MHYGKQGEKMLDEEETEVMWRWKIMEDTPDEEKMQGNRGKNAG